MFEWMWRSRKSNGIEEGLDIVFRFKTTLPLVVIKWQKRHHDIISPGSSRYSLPFSLGGVSHISAYLLNNGMKMTLFTYIYLQIREMRIRFILYTEDSFCLNIRFFHLLLLYFNGTRTLLSMLQRFFKVSFIICCL